MSLAPEHNKATQPASRLEGDGQLVRRGDDLLTLDQVAERLNTSTRFVRRLVTERRIRFTKIGKYIRFTSADVEMFIEAGRVEPGVSYVRPTLWSSTTGAGYGRR